MKFQKCYADNKTQAFGGISLLDRSIYRNTAHWTIVADDETVLFCTLEHHELFETVWCIKACTAAGTNNWGQKRRNAIMNEVQQEAVMILNAGVHYAFHFMQRTH